MRAHVSLADRSPIVNDQSMIGGLGTSCTLPRPPSSRILSHDCAFQHHEVVGQSVSAHANSGNDRLISLAAGSTKVRLSTLGHPRTDSHTIRVCILGRTSDHDGEVTLISTLR